MEGLKKDRRERGGSQIVERRMQVPINADRLQPLSRHQSVAAGVLPTTYTGQCGTVLLPTTYTG